MNPTWKHWTTVALIALAIIAFVLFAARFSGATTQKSGNSLGVVTYTMNPNLYLAGYVVDYAIIGEADALSMRVKPLATYLLFDENLLFCGVPAEKLDGHENPVVFVYSRISSRRVGGVGCHDLIEVRDIKPEIRDVRGDTK
jgi:hypothetical protein